MSEVNVAYEVLSDSERRANYDATGKDRIDDQRAAAQALVVQRVLQWLQTTDGERDMIAAILQTFDVDRRTIAANRAQGEKVIAHLHKALKKLTFKGAGNDVLRMAIEGQVANIEQQLKLLENELKRIDLAREIAQGYSYEAVAQTPHLMSHMYTTSWTTV